jgi:hypothetical protein
VRGTLWHWNVQKIKGFWNVFTGRKIIMIVTDKSTDDPSVVLKELSFPVESIVQKNDRSLGETKTFMDGLSRLQSLNINEATFYAHAKGVTRNSEPVKAWADTLYNLNLSVPAAIDILLGNYAVVGALRRPCTHVAPFSHDWFFEGSFYWMKHSELFKRNWRNMLHGYYGTEHYPGLQFREEETYSIFNKARSPYQDIIKKSEYEYAIAALRAMVG